MHPDTTRQAIERYFAAIGQTDADGLSALFTEDAQFQDPVGTPVLVGHEGVRKFHRGLTRAWQSLKMTPLSIHIRANQAAASWRAEGTSAGGKSITFDGINTFHVAEDGRVAELAGYWDLEGVVAQF